MAKYTYDDMVRVVKSARKDFRPGQLASVIGVFSERPKGKYFDQFPDGVVYTIEFENGDAIDIHESDLELYKK